MSYLHRLLTVASTAFFIASAASAQTGTVTNHAFAVGKGAGVTGFTSLLCTSAQLAVGQAAADPICRTITGDVTLSSAGATTIGATKVTSAMLNADVFSTAHSWAGQQTFTAPILGTPASDTLTNATGLPISTGVSGLGTGVATALGVNVGSAGAFVTFNGALGTPSSGTLTNATGLPVSTGISGLGTGVATFLGTPSSANLRGALTDESGTGAAYFQGGDIGTPSAGVLTNATGLPVSTGISGFGTGVATFLATPSSANLRAALTDEVGTGAAYFVGGALGTPASGTATNLTGLPLTTGVTGTLPLGNGGTGQTTAATARASSGLNIDQMTTHGDSIYTILSTDRVVATSAAFTASRTWTLPAANSLNAGQSVMVTDLAGGVTATNTLIIARAGADTINGTTSVTMTAANGAYFLVSDGSSKWTAQSMGAASGGGVTSVTCGTGLNGGTITTSGTCDIAAGAIETAWSAFTPTLTCGSATFTTTSARRKTMGKTSFVSLDFTITALGTCNNAITFTLPNTANAGASLVGTETVVSGKTLSCRVIAASATSICAKADASIFIVNERFVVSGVYENQ